MSYLCVCTYIRMFIFTCVYNEYCVQIIWIRRAGILGIQFGMRVRRFYSFQDGQEVCVYCTHMKCHVPCKHTLRLNYFQVPITNVPTVIHGAE